MAGAEDWEDLAARLADWGVVMTGGGEGLTLREACGAMIATCVAPPGLGPVEAHFAG